MLLERGTAPDPSSVISNSFALRTLSASAASAVTAALQYVELPAGAALFPEDDRIDAMYVVHQGVLARAVMDFPRLAELVALGYDYARTAIASWREREMPIPTGDVTRERRAAAPFSPAVTIPV